MDSYLLPYLLLMAHFVSGAVWLILINRKMGPAESRTQWIKYFTYLLLVNLLWYCMIFLPEAFPWLGMLLMLLAWMEWWRRTKALEGKIWYILPFLMVLAGFWAFLFREQTLLLFTWFVVVIFDGSSQITGQLIGKRKLLPRISPGKTAEGLVGGWMLTLASALLVRRSFSFGWMEVILMSCLVMGAAFLGDLLASSVKRKAGVKNYGNILPGHGGVLDRFDSLIMAGAIMYLVSLVHRLGT